MPVHETFAGTTTAQGRNADDTVTSTIPKEIAEELGIEPGEPVLWKCDEGDEVAKIKRPNQR